MAIVVYQKYLHFVFIFTSLFQYAFGQDCPPDLATMQNTVVYEGNSTSFPRATSGGPAQWQVASSSNSNPPESITNPDGTVATKYATTYAVTPSQLTISKATTAPEGSMPDATAGVYLLSYQDAGCTTGAGLVVIKSGPICVSDASNPNAVKLTCSVVFAGYAAQQINPNITWKNSSETVKQSVPPRTSLDLSNPGLQSSTDSLQVSNDDSTTYECQLTFTAPPNDDNIPTFLAQNAPTFTASCSISNAFAQDCPPNLAQNTVVYEGATASFPRATNGDTAQWRLGPSNDPNSFVSITNPDGTVDPQYATTYTVDSSQLKISKATTAPEGTTSFATAGLYLLSYQDPACTTGAGLVVIKSGPICVSDASNPNAVKLTCSVVFAGYTQQQINPNITWKTSSGTVKQSVPPRTSLDLSNPGLQSSTDSLQVSNDDSTTYECQLTFTAPANDDNIPTSIAQNAPNFTASCFISNNLTTTTTTTTTMITTTTMMTPSEASTSNPSLPSASVVALSSPSSATAAATDTPVTSTPSVLTPSTSTPSSSSSSTSPSGQSPLSSAPVATRPPARTTTATPDNNDTVGKTLAISLGLVLGAFAVGAVACSCWCTGCCLLIPVGAKRTKQPQRRRYYQTPYFSPRWYPDIEET